MTQEELFKKLVAHCKEYGFVFPSSEIYDGLAAVYDYGQNGVELKNNIKRYWWDSMVKLHENIVGLDAAIFMHPKTWEASGHVSAFNDPLIDNRDSKKRYRADVLIEDWLAKQDEKIEKEVEKARKRFGETFDEAKYRETSPRVVEVLARRAVHERFTEAMNANDLAGLRQIIVDCEIVCPISGTRNWTEVRQFNLMFSTQMGSTAEGANTIYLRPETAQGIFVNFLNVQKTGRMKLPFGIAQIGKAFRNEIVARQFIFRMREFEQMEMQFFVRPGTEMEWWNRWKETRMAGIAPRASATTTTVSTTTTSWPTTPMPRPTSSTTSRSASRRSRASIRARTSIRATTRSSRARRSRFRSRDGRAMCPMWSRPRSASTACSCRSCRPHTPRSSSRAAIRACCACRQPGSRQGGHPAAPEEGRHARWRRRSSMS